MDAVIIKVGDAYTKYHFDSDKSSGLTLGRAFSNDIIVNDPYIDESLLSIAPASDESYHWHIKIIDHTNPVFLNKKNVESRDVNLRSGDVITIGRTNIVFFSEGHNVPATREFSYTNWLHNHKFKPYITLLLLSVLFITSVLMSYLEISTKPDWGLIYYASITFVVFALLWASGWSLAGRVLKGHAYFSSHLFFTSFCFILMLLVADLGSYVDYIFSSPLSGNIINWLVAFVLGGLLIGLNLSLVSNSPRVARNGMMLSACITGAIAIMVYINQPEYSNKPAHSVTIKPAFIPTTSPVSLDIYISDYDEMFDRLSLMKKELALEE